MLLDKLEELLEGVLEGLKARKKIAPLNDELEKLRTENSNLQRELNVANDTVKNLRVDVESYSAEVKNFKSQLENLRTENSNLQYELDAANDTVKNLRGDVENYSAEVKNFKSQLETLRTENSTLQENLNKANATANSYRKTYSRLEEIYKLYRTLDDDARYNLAGIFGAGETATEFLSGAVQEDHIDSLWDYIARHNSDTLQKIFDYAFEMYNKGFRDAPYSRLTISQGDYYDDEFMNRTPSSPQMGNVSRVLFQGYKYSTGNVIKKSIVELG